MKNLCLREAQRKPDSDLRNEYRHRLENEDNQRLVKPYCQPTRGRGGYEHTEWVATKDIFLESDFDYHHHSKDEILDYSIEHRGDYKRHHDSMRGLWLDEYPAPNDKGNIFFVGTNGNHRRLVYSCIGLPHSYAKVQALNENKWVYYSTNRSAFRLLNFFFLYALIDWIERDDQNSCTFTASHPVTLWLLPDPNLGSLSNMFEDIKRRLESIESVFGPISSRKLDVLRSPFRLRLLLAWYELKSAFRSFSGRR